MVGHDHRARPAPRPAAATDPGLAKDARDLELPPWNKGRYGTAIGRAVHAVLQTVDLATGDGLDDAAAAQAAAEGVLGMEDEIAALGPLGARVAAVREAVAHGATGARCTSPRRSGDTLLEGYVDLVYRTPDGLVVVDYKTDAWRADADLDAKLARYRLQGASYALALGRRRASPSPGACSCSSRRDRVARDVERLDDAMAIVQRTGGTRLGAERYSSGTPSVCSRANTSTPPIGPVTTTSAT